MSKLPENCPICGEKMEEGYVFPASGRGSAFFCWSKNQPTIWHIPKDREILLRWVWSITEKSISKAFRCPNCKIVLFSYGEEKKEE